MENEEITTNVTETETVYEETPAENTDTSLSGEVSGDTNLGDVPSVPVTEQSEETGSDVMSDSNETGTTSDAPATDEEEETERTFTEEEFEQIMTAVLMSEEETVTEIEAQTEETTEIPRTLFNTHLDEYTVSEGLLVCIFLLMLANFIHSIFKGSHWFGRM